MLFFFISFAIHWMSGAVPEVFPFGDHGIAQIPAGSFPEVLPLLSFGHPGSDARDVPAEKRADIPLRYQGVSGLKERISRIPVSRSVSRRAVFSSPFFRKWSMSAISKSTNNVMISGTVGNLPRSSSATLRELEIFSSVREVSFLRRCFRCCVMCRTSAHAYSGRSGNSDARSSKIFSASDPIPPGSSVFESWGFRVRKTAARKRYSGFFGSKVKSFLRNINAWLFSCSAIVPGIVCQAQTAVNSSLGASSMSVCARISRQSLFASSVRSCFRSDWDRKKRA